MIWELQILGREENNIWDKINKSTFVLSGTNVKIIIKQASASVFIKPNHFGIVK